jgi:hypothetical protein
MHHMTHKIVNFIFNYHHLDIEDFHPAIVTVLESVF